MRAAAFISLCASLVLLFPARLIAAGAGTSTEEKTPLDAADPFLWLEEVDGARALEWVRSENARTSGVLDHDPHFAVFYQEALALSQAADRIPEPALLGGRIYNHWQDAQHAHGLWRQASFRDYQRPAPAWTTVLDLDALSAQEKANWFWSGADCLQPAERRCMLALSDGGEDAVTEREFDLRSAKFVPGGFSLPRGKQGLAWQDRDTLWVSREWSPGELTASGYPYVVKRLRRGEPLGSAQELFRGERSDVGVFPRALQDDGGHQALFLERAVSFFETEYQLQTPAGLVRLGLPRKSNLVGLIDGRLILELREDWQSAGGAKFAQGSLVAIDLAQVLAAPADPRPALVYAPAPGHAYAQAAVTRHHLLVTELDNVKGRAYIYTPTGAQQWSQRALALPDYASIDIIDTDLHSDRAFLQVTGFLTPSKLWFADLASGELQGVKTLPARFDASRHVVEQLAAVSKDGTRIPYFIVYPRDARRDGTTPTILTAYGGFQVSETPYYSAGTGKLWLERGGAFVVANIRGGGEFGPAWHEAGLKTHRQCIYDDFAAVAQDLIARGFTSAARLGIRGGSNGGLLMGVEFNQRPELWGAVDIEVPLLDMLRYEQIAAGASWVGEYGSVAVPEERAFLAAISPYQNLKAGVNYPEPLVWSTTKDDRVGPQHARKFAARLAQLGAPYLFYEVIEGGHGAGATLDEQSAMSAREFTYFARKLSLPLEAQGTTGSPDLHSR
ncbi:MAG TPA: prolyl oligopeptidase family serine peptidase [Steroidobacteraceae bacterium]|nr:prolyl oligopeptidase family serine peptidase [Steroidobacteraceae bacterium]